MDGTRNSPLPARTRADIRIFVWCPKTAGGTLSAGIQRNPGVRWLGTLPSPDTLPAPSSDQLWVAGHTTFGQHRLYGCEPVYFTILRDPIERLISEFFYSHQQALPGMLIPEDERLAAFIRYVESAEHLNYYCYMFADSCADKEAAYQGLPAWRGDPETGFDLIHARATRNGYLTHQVPFHTVSIEATFRRAMRNIALMRFIAFFDQLRDATACLQSEFGLTIDLAVRNNVTPGKPNLSDLPAGVLATLKRKTEADFALFHAAATAPNAASSRAR